MKIEDQVCTLEQAKRLAELGIETESLFEWIEFDEDDAPEITLIDRRYSRPNIPAYTVAELGEMLPRELHSTAAKESRRVLNSANDYVGFGKNSKGWFCRETEGADLKIFPTEAQARAAMLIYLLETGIINHEQIQS